MPISYHSSQTEFSIFEDNLRQGVPLATSTGNWSSGQKRKLEHLVSKDCLEIQHMLRLHEARLRSSIAGRKIQELMVRSLNWEGDLLIDLHLQIGKESEISQREAVSTRYSIFIFILGTR